MEPVSLSLGVSLVDGSRFKGCSALELAQHLNEGWRIVAVINTQAVQPIGNMRTTSYTLVQFILEAPQKTVPAN